MKPVYGPRYVPPYVPHLRVKLFRFNLTYEDGLQCLRRFADLYPTAVYINARADPGGKTDDSYWSFIDEKGNRSPLLTNEPLSKPGIFHRSMESCIAAVPPAQFHGSGERYKVLRVRAPWPEELQDGRLQALVGSRKSPMGSYDYVDPKKWRAYGRYVRVKLCMDYPTFEQVEWKLNGRTKFCQLPKNRGEYRNETSFSFHYDNKEPENHKFMLSIKNLTRGMLTTKEIGAYDLESGRFLKMYPAGRPLSRRALKLASLMEDTYLYDSLASIKIIPSLGLSASPALKAEAYLEAGRSLEGISGLDAKTRDKVLRNFEKEQRLRGSDATK